MRGGVVKWKHMVQWKKNQGVNDLTGAIREGWHEALILGLFKEVLYTSLVCSTDSWSP